MSFHVEGFSSLWIQKEKKKKKQDKKNPQKTDDPVRHLHEGSQIHHPYDVLDHQTQHLSRCTHKYWSKHTFVSHSMNL